MKPLRYTDDRSDWREWRRRKLVRSTTQCRADGIMVHRPQDDKGKRNPFVAADEDVANLAIAKWSVQRQGGRMEVACEVGKGSKFRTVLPQTV